MTCWLARAAGDIVRNTALTFADLAQLTDEQILVLAASAARESKAIEEQSGSAGTPLKPRVEGFRDEAELKANYLQLGRALGLSPEQCEREFQACKERGAEFKPRGK